MLNEDPKATAVQAVNDLRRQALPMCSQPGNPDSGQIVGRRLWQYLVSEYFRPAPQSASQLRLGYRHDPMQSLSGGPPESKRLRAELIARQHRAAEPGVSNQ
jgi:hypothetical protein